MAFENDTQRTSSKRYNLPNVEIKDYNVMTDGKNFFDQPIKNDKITYGNIRKIATGQGDDCTIVCLLDYAYFKNYFKLIEIDLSKQQALDAKPRANSKFRQCRKHKDLFHSWRSKRNSFGLFKRNCKSFVNAIPLSDLIFISIKWHNTTI